MKMNKNDMDNQVCKEIADEFFADLEKNPKAKDEFDEIMLWLI